MKKIIFVIFVILNHNNFITSQSIQDGEFVFKSLFYFDRPVMLIDTINHGRALSDFNSFIKNTNLTLDTLESNLFDNYVFISLKYSNKNILNNEGFYQSKSISRSKEVLKYIICINKETGAFYRIRGFNQTDLLSFWDSIKSQEELLKRNKSLKIFLNNFWVKDLDLKCIFSSMGKPHDVKKYPCTFNESDLIVITY